MVSAQSSTKPLTLAATLPVANDPPDACRDYLHAVEEELSALFHPTQAVRPLLAARADAVDNVLQRLWAHFIGNPEGILLAAVGGYGRGELFPHSDVDILFLLSDNVAPEIEADIATMLRSLWDLGLTVGQSVRRLDECAELARQDLTIFTAMLEARSVVGDQTLLAALSGVLSQDNMWDSKAFFSAKLAETRLRHSKFADTTYSLEPNVKNGPGALRDIQVVGWMARRHFGVPMAQLEHEHFLTADEQLMLESGQNFIGQVRFAMHMIARREEDRLLFDNQRKLAEIWQMVDGETLAVEQFMQVYYRWTHALAQLTELLLECFDQQILHADDVEPAEQLSEDFELSRGQLVARHRGVFTRQPSNLLRLFLIIANSPRIHGIAPETLRLVRASAPLIDATFRSEHENQQLFMTLMSSPHGLTKQLRRMTAHGILGRYLPEFGAIMGQMQFDLFHSLTVDAHTLAVVANTRRFMRADYTDKFPVSTRIAQRLRKPALLYIAALYHDIGKGRGGDHSELGAVDAQDFCERHSLDARDTELVVWLVKNHLVMSSISQRKDISDPEEIVKFASHVATEERLDYLYTLTVADIHGTNPELWNAWRSSLLRQLYTAARRALRRGLENPLGRQDVVLATRKAATELLENRGFLEDDLQLIWATRGVDYFLRERPEDIAWHTEAIADHDHRDSALVLVRQSTDSTIANATQIFVYALVEAGLFARVCGELEIQELSINDARIYSGTDGAALYTFFVLQADGNSVSNDEQTLEGLRRALQQALDQGGTRSVSRRTPRQLKSFLMPTETHIHQDQDRNWTVLEVATPDRPGLLASLGEIFIAFDIALKAAKIQTLGERVEDVFFLTDSRGGQITDQTGLADLQAAICDALDKGVRESA